MKKFYFLILAFIALYFQSCRYDKIDVTAEAGVAGYDEAVGKIFLTTCAVTGCHTTHDKHLAGGLDLSSWDALFQGARNGSPVVPFSSKYSFLCYFINSYPDLGVTNADVGNTMPPAPAPVLSHEDVEKVMDWINDGARDKDGNLKFPDSPSRKKIYAANSGCDEVAVIDAETRQIMRYVSVGMDATNEQPHNIRVSPDGTFWCIVSRNGQYLQKYSTVDDSPLGEAFLGPGFWNSVTITPDGNHAFVTDFRLSTFGGKVVHVNLQTMNLTGSYSPMDSPHGAYFMQTQNVLYVSAQYGNFIYKFDFSTDPNYTFIDNPAIITMQAGASVTTTSSFDPHEIIFTPDESKYFVTCQNSNEVRVFNAANDSLIDSVAVGGFPQEMAISPSHNYLLITCQEDSTSSEVQPFIEKGSVFIYNYQSGQLVPINNTATLGLTRVYQPHGIAVDEASGKAFVASLNYSTDGPAPHHPGGCSGRNGFMTAIDLNTLEYVNFFVSDLQFTYLYKAELLSFPYSVMAK